jgi:2-polyprenyl-3-methyl-5-hydroxy-6-metoxy-1,4-benzoquinol methylase
MTNSNYFDYRNIDIYFYNNYEVPAYLLPRLNKNSSILDFGCGFGQLLFALKKAGFTSLEGADINQAAIEHLKNNGLLVHDLSSNNHQFYESNANKYDSVVLGHVLEHFPKDEVISLLKQIRGLLKKGGQLIVMVPNAQSSTGCYWAFEDFTHNTLFTAGSLYYVLRASGFSQVEFVDIDCTDGMNPINKFVKRVLLDIYRLKIKFWNKVTSSAFHAPSPQIFSYEIKAIARA